MYVTLCHRDAILVVKAIEKNMSLKYFQLKQPVLKSPHKYWRKGGGREIKHDYHKKPDFLAIAGMQLIE